MRVFWLALVATVICVAGVSPVRAQAYPDKPVRLIVPFAPGGGTDLTARIVADALTKSLGQNFIVENRVGAGSQLGIEYVAKARKDGYTLLWASADGISILPAVKPSVPYKIPGSFAFVSSFSSFPLILGVSAKLPIHDMSELVAYAHANPGKLHYASSGAGGGGHLHPAYFAKLIGADMTHVPYDGAAPAVVAVAGGFADICDVAPSSIASYVHAGTVRGIATSGQARSSMLPDVPTVGELKYPDLTVDLFYGMLAPAGTPQAIVDRLQAAVAAVLHQQSTVDRLHSLGLEPLDLGTDQFRDFVVRDETHWQAIAKAVNVHIGG